MPVIKTFSSTPITADARETLKAAFGEAITAVPGKSEQWLMCLFEGDTPIYFAGSDAEPAVYVEVGVFARGEVAAASWQEMTERITPVIAETLDVDPAHIYISYGWTPSFGWNGSNF